MLQMFLGYKYVLRFILIKPSFFHKYMDRSCRKSFNQNNYFCQGITLLLYFCLFYRFLFLLNKHHLTKNSKINTQKCSRLAQKYSPTVEDVPQAHKAVVWCPWRDETCRRDKDTTQREREKGESERRLKRKKERKKERWEVARDENRGTLGDFFFFLPFYMLMRGGLDTLGKKNFYPYNRPYPTRIHPKTAWLGKICWLGGFLPSPIGVGIRNWFGKSCSSNLGEKFGPQIDNLKG
jgi:hypothetical protein